MSQPRSPARRRLGLWNCLLAASLVVAVSITVVLIMITVNAALPAHVSTPTPDPGGDSQPGDDHSFQVVGQLRGLSDLVAGDGTYPVALPDGRTAWLFGDCRFRTAGGVAGVRNAILLQDARQRFRLLTGRAAAGPTDLIPRARPNTWLWPSSGFVEYGHLMVFAEEFKATLQPNGKVGFLATNHRYLVGLALPSLRPLPGPPHEVYVGPISWGHAVLVRGSEVYVYGNLQQDHGWTNLTYLARFPLGASTGYWQFWNGRDFVPYPRAAVPLRGSDGARLTTELSSVIPNPDPQARVAGVGVAALTMQPFGATFDLRTATRPEGPFGASRVLYQVPDRKKLAYLPRARLDPDGAIHLAYSVWANPPRFVVIK
jgi:hypothetical protein